MDKKYDDLLKKVQTLEEKNEKLNRDIDELIGMVRKLISMHKPELMGRVPSSYFIEETTIERERNRGWLNPLGWFQ